LTDTLASGLGSSNTTGLSSMSNSSSTGTSGAISLLSYIGAPASVASNVSTSTYSTSPAMQMDYQGKKEFQSNKIIFLIVFF